MRKYIQNIHRPWKDPFENENVFETSEFQLHEVEFEPNYALNHNPNRLPTEDEDQDPNQRDSFKEYKRKKFVNRQFRKATEDSSD